MLRPQRPCRCRPHRADQRRRGRGTCEFIAHSSAGEPVRKAIAAAVVGHGWGLIEVRPLAMSLEDLFVRLVTEEEGNHGT